MVLTSRGTDPRIEQARRAVAVVFALCGLEFASWAARSPAIRDELGLTSSGFGLLLLSFSIGSLPQQPADELLTAPVAVDVGGVEERHARVERRPQHVEGVVLRHRAPVGAELPAAEADHRDLAAGASELSRLHVWRL